MRYAPILLDADDTVFDFYAAETFALEKALAEVGYTAPASTYLSEFRRINGPLWEALEAGQIDSQTLRVARFSQLLPLLGLAADPATLSTRYLSYLGQADALLPGAIEFLDAVAGKAPVVLLTNGIGVVQRSRLERSGLSARFAAVVISEEVGSQKPDPAIFEHALNLVPEQPGLSPVMIGDGLGSDIRGAMDAGIESIWVNVRNKPKPDDISPTWTVTSLREAIPLVVG
ncbi:MAG: YjjG family noncanonical pyrimidine nucleotidase [Spirochaetales bacterium]